MRNVSRLRLLCFLLFTSLLMCCPLCYSLPCRNYAPPSKAFLISSILVAINPLSTFSDPASSLEYFWWRWGDSHPRPEPVSLCFIQQYHLIMLLLYINHRRLATGNCMFTKLITPRLFGFTIVFTCKSLFN